MQSIAPKDAPELCDFIINHKAIRRINFTGSDKVGRAIAASAAKCLKPTLLELGGKAPVLILGNTSDQNLEEAVSAVVYGEQIFASFLLCACVTREWTDSCPAAGVLMNSGQICMSTERVIVANSIADTFTAKLKARMEKIKTGNHLKDPSVDLSGLIHQASADRCIKLLKEAVEAGATPVLGDFKANGTIVQPHILDNVNNTMRAFVEESFGPSK